MIYLKIVNKAESLEQKKIHLEIVELLKKNTNIAKMIYRATVNALTFKEELDTQKRIIPLLMTKYEEQLSSVYELMEKLVQINDVKERTFLNTCSSTLKERNELKIVSEIVANM
jgi:hypothetical protein